MNDDQLLRYSRHLLLPQLDMAGQEKLLAAKVLIVGLGGLGSPLAMYLAASGIGTLYINDFDEVDKSNLQRQVLHTEKTVGISKVSSAKQNLQALNSTCNLIELPKKLTKNYLLELLPKIDVAVDCSDNFSTRMLLNEACVKTKKPLVSGAAIRFEGQVGVFHNTVETDACYSCLYFDLSGEEELAETCSETGVLSPVVGVIGSLQAVEVVKVITGIGETLRNKLLVYDGLHQKFRTITFARDTSCKTCS